MRLAFGIFLLLSVAACRHVHPWERGVLAQPSMTTAGSPPPAEEHVYSVQEGAVGGTSTAESGCGCN